MYKLLFLLLFFCISKGGFCYEFKKENITIKRDQWGVPHIYGKTDEDVAYGLAWATAEDDFQSMQENLLIAKRRSGEVKGKEGAIADFFSYLVDVDNIVEAHYDTSFTPKFKNMLEAYALATNTYAEKHPDEVLLKGIFPINAKDIVKGYVFVVTFMSNLHYELIKIVNGSIKQYEDIMNYGHGSNGFAISKSRTANNKTFLAINSHQPLEGPQSWYECHLISQEGWDMMGGTFPGGMSIFHGTNRNLGWAHTTNWPDLTDVYKLTMHPKKKYHYKYDGAWLPLKVQKIKLKVKVWFFKIPIKRKLFWSKYGPTLKSKKTFYALRFPANMTIKTAEQWYRMNKSNNFEEFKAALTMNAAPALNTIYADKNDNLFYISLGHFPYRNPNYDWKKVLSGDTSATMWYPPFYNITEFPQIENPQCGYIFNTNNSPFNATCDAENIQYLSIDTTFGYMRPNNNRALRLKYLIEADTSLTYKEFQAIKFDRSYMKPTYTWLMSNIEELMTIDENEHPKLKEVSRIIKSWDRVADGDSEAASILTLAIKHIISKLLDEGKIGNQESNVSKELMIESLLEAQKHLKKHFKTIRVPLGKLQRLQRGNVDLPLAGMPDVLAAMTPKEGKKGRLIADFGESYIMLVQYDESGPIIETINAFGSSNKPSSPHYTDQMEMFVQQKLKPMTFDSLAIANNAKKVYHPN